MFPFLSSFRITPIKYQLLYSHPSALTSVPPKLYIRRTPYQADSGALEMIRRVHRKYSMDEMLSLMDPLLQEWFRERYEKLTPPQAYTVPLIHRGKNVLVSSPTGSGKTITAFLSIINELYLLQKKGKLEDRIYCLYISPLKALANDINRNLETPLRELREQAERKGLEPPDIRVGVRSGDTSQSERAKMARKPPHIFITTPESISLILSTTKFSNKFSQVRYLIVDEIHELTSSKRGVMLALAMERLEALIQRGPRQEEPYTESEKPAMKKPAVLSRPPVRIGLSATQAPIEEIARFLAGYKQGLSAEESPPEIPELPTHDHLLRPMNIIEVTERKPLDLRVVSPVEDMNLLPFEVVNARMYDLLAELIRDHTTTLVFTNTRSATEAVVFKLKEKGIRDIEAHHGSLSRETRLDVEERLKKGELRVVVSSTSLELGIDIGSIDLVVQLNSPKTVAKGLQRIGRAGHGVYDISKGRIVVFDRDDLIESAVLTRYAYDGFIDRIHILHNSLDVLAQFMVGISLEQRWELHEAYSTTTRAYPFRCLSYADFLGVLRYVGGGSSDYIYSKIWLDEQSGSFGIKRGSRMIYNMNLGTIPQESSFKVLLQQRGLHLGSLSEKFVEKLDPGDIFVLGGKTYEFLESEGMRVIVQNAHGRKPTVPSWAGEMLPRSFDLSLGVGKFRSYVASLLGKIQDRKVIEDRLMEEYLLDRGSARTIVNYISEQVSIIPAIPSDTTLLIEGFIDERGRRNLIYHFPFGRRVNDALSRAYARVISRRLSTNVKISLTDDNFMLTFSHRLPVEGTAKLIESRDLEKTLRDSIRYTELFKQRFRHCANRGFMILRNYLGKEIPMGKQQFRTVRILEAIHGLEDHPILKETYNEILHDVMDIDNALEVLRGIESGSIKVEYEDYHEIPSPLAHNIVLMGISDIVLMEDRSALLRELHKKVLATAFSEEEFKYRISLLEEYFKEKRPFVEGKEDLIEVISQLQPLNLFIERGRNIYEYSDVERSLLEKWCRELVDQEVVVSVWKDGELWALSRDAGDFEALYSVKLPLEEEEQELLENIPYSIVDGPEHNEKMKDRVEQKVEKKSEEIVTSEPQESLSRDEVISLTRKLDRRKDTLRKFQRGYLIKCNYLKTKDGFQKVYVRRRKKKAEYEASLDRVILRHLSLFAPSNLEELSYYLSLSEGILKQARDELVESGIVVPGAFVIGKLTPQYMLAEDEKALDIILSGNYRVFQESTILAYLHEKQLVDDIDSYFALFGSATSARVVFQHVKNFSSQRWIELMEKHVVQGRFVRHRVNFVMKDQVPVYEAAYRETEPLEPLDHRVYHHIEKHPGCTKREITQSIEAPQDIVEESIERLDYSLNLIRIPEARVGGEFSSINRYRIIDDFLEIEMDEQDDVMELHLDGSPESDLNGNENDNKNDNTVSPIGGTVGKTIGDPDIKLDPLDSQNTRPMDYETAREMIILQHLKAFGPTTLSDLRRGTMFRTEEIERVISRNRDSIEKITVVGDVEMVMYLMDEDLVKLEEFQDEPPGLIIHSRMDPSIRHLMPEIRSRFGEGWFSPLVYNARPVGVVIHWTMSNAIDVRDIILQEGFEEDHPEELAQALDEFMRFYRETGNDVLRIRRIARKEIRELDKNILSAFIGAGFRRIHSWLVLGDVINRSYEAKELLSYMFYKHHLHKDNLFEDPLEAVEEMGGIRNNFELQLRLRNPEPLQMSTRKYHLVNGIALPPYLLTMTMEQAGIYQKAKDVPLTPEMEEILKALSGRMHYKDLFIRTTLQPSTFKQSLKKLRDGLYILKLPWSYFMRVPPAGMDKKEAKEWVFRKAVESFGLVTPEKLSSYFKGVYRMGEIRSILAAMVSEGVLRKGFLNKKDENLYYIMEKDTRNVLRHPFHQEFVLSPQDRLFHYLAEDIKSRFGLGACYVVFRGNEMAGAFRIRKQGRHITIRDFVGGVEEKRIVRYWGSVNSFILEWS